MRLSSWPVAIWFFFNFAVFFSFAGLWGGPYLIHVYGMEKPEAGRILSMMAIGMIIGSPVQSYLSTNLFKARKPVIVLSTCVVVALTRAGRAAIPPPDTCLETGDVLVLSATQEAAAEVRDMIAAQDKLVTIDNIQRTVSEYYKIRASDLLSSKRSRMIARPRQVAMALAKELTNHSLPEIGENFGGRDHTTVLYATRKVAELRDADNRFNDDYQALLRILSH